MLGARDFDPGSVLERATFDAAADVPIDKCLKNLQSVGILKDLVAVLIDDRFKRRRIRKAWRTCY